MHEHLSCLKGIRYADIVSTPKSPLASPLLRTRNDSCSGLHCVRILLVQHVQQLLRVHHMQQSSQYMQSFDHAMLLLYLVNMWHGQPQNILPPL